MCVYYISTEFAVVLGIFFLFFAYISRLASSFICFRVAFFLVCLDVWAIFLASFQFTFCNFLANKTPAASALATAAHTTHFATYPKSNKLFNVHCACTFEREEPTTTKNRQIQ